MSQTAGETADGDEIRRLERHLRALSAVNRSLHAQLESGSIHAAGPAARTGGDLLESADVRRAPLTVRRASTAGPWIEQLQVTSGGGEPTLVRRPSGGVSVVEGRYRREVGSGLLVAALAEQFGEPRDITDGEFDGLDEGAPVEVLEGPKGRPFVIVGGQRISIRGLPLPHPVSAEEMQLFPAGVEVNLAAANVARSKFEDAYSGRYQVSQARAAVARKGVVPAARSLGRRVSRRLGSGKDSTD